MTGGRWLCLIVVMATVLLAAAVASAARWQARVAVHVPPHPAVGSDVTISFRPHGRLPKGGYFYAVAVLEGYHSGSSGPPECAISSDMSDTEYGFQRSGRRVSLTLRPAKSPGGGWCRGGRYEGAVYAVPHRPPCSKEYPCYEHGSPCPTVCGVVVRPEYPYSYPGGLPKPIDRQSTIIGHFTLKFEEPEEAPDRVKA